MSGAWAEVTDVTAAVVTDVAAGTDMLFPDALASWCSTGASTVTADDVRRMIGGAVTDECIMGTGALNGRTCCSEAAFDVVTLSVVCVVLTLLAVDVTTNAGAAMI